MKDLNECLKHIATIVTVMVVYAFIIEAFNHLDALKSLTCSGESIGRVNIETVARLTELR